MVRVAGTADADWFLRGGRAAYDAIAAHVPLAELDSVLANLARTVARIAVLAQPFIPATAEVVWATLGPPPSSPLARVRLGDLEALDPAGWRVQKPPILFPKPR